MILLFAVGGEFGLRGGTHLYIWGLEKTGAHTADLGASGASYLMCDCNYFPKKIKAT